MNKNRTNQYNRLVPILRNLSAAKKKKSLSSIDRLSDDILVHILSLLPLKFSATTSILGRRWRFLWAYTPNLQFNSDNHHSRTSFADIIDRVMMLHKGYDINTFDLCLYDNCSDYKFEAWIATLIACNVRNLTITLKRQVMLPHCLFTCKTLVHLCLSHVGNIPTTGPVHFPTLKRLDLYWVRYESDESLPHLLSGCPVLEELTMNTIQNMTRCSICSSTLNRLVIESHYRGVQYKACWLMLDTPALRYIHLNDFTFADFSIGALTSLIEANIDFECTNVTGGEVLYSHPVIEFVGKLSNVECLHLSTRQMPVHDYAFEALAIKFHHLTKLDLVADHRFVPIFLENADNLEVLNIWIVDGTNVKEWMEPRKVPTCLSLHLRTVKIRPFKRTEFEFELIRYLLMNAEVLKLMEITSHFTINSNERLDALKRISKFPRGSKACVLDFL